MPLVEGVLSGMNSAILCYGQTGSGKTYTMSGDAAAPGIMPRMIGDLFERMADQSMVDVVLSYVEIYNERLIDLISGTWLSTQPNSPPSPHFLTTCFHVVVTIIFVVNQSDEVT